MAKFQPGKSGNPSGRPKDVGHIRALAQQHAASALETLVAIYSDVNEKGSTRVAAADSILNRAYGRPEQAVSLEGPGGEAIVPNIQIILTKRGE